MCFCLSITLAIDKGDLDPFTDELDKGAYTTHWQRSLDCCERRCSRGLVYDVSLDFASDTLSCELMLRSVRGVGTLEQLEDCFWVRVGVVLQHSSIPSCVCPLDARHPVKQEMFAPITNFVKRRHRGLAVAASVVGGSYLLLQYAKQRFQDLSEKLVLDRAAKEKYVPSRLSSEK